MRVYVCMLSSGVECSGTLNRPASRRSAAHTRTAPAVNYQKSASITVLGSDEDQLRTNKQESSTR